MIKKTVRIISIILSVVILFTSIILLSLTRIIHDERNIYVIENFNFLEKVQIQEGTISIGKNKVGAIEAIIIPNNQEFFNNKEIEYLYIRFDPLWYQKNIKRKLKDRVDADINHIRKIHNDNFKSFMHYNDSPLIIPGIRIGNLKLKGRERKELLFDLKDFKEKKNVSFYEDIRNWNEITKDHVTIFFPNESIIKDNYDNWINARIEAFNNILNELNVNWENKDNIYIYVFDDDKHGEKYGFKLGFAKPADKEIYTRFDQTKGHEIAHVISYYINDGQRINSALINEGMATFYDQNNRDYSKLSKEILSKNSYDINIFGDNFRKNENAYTLGASFVGFLIDTYSKELFLEFFAQNKYSETDSFIHYYVKMDIPVKVATISGLKLPPCDI